MPIPLFLSAEFLHANRLSLKTHDLLRRLLEIFGDLKNVNDPTQSYIQILELSCISASLELAEHVARTQE
jgi:hypothetical protein